MVTPQYLHFTQQVISSHDKANKQAEMDVSPTMGDMLTEMQGCLKQHCGNSAAGNPEAVAQLIAEKMAAMNVWVQDNCDDVPALPEAVQEAAANAHVGLPSEALGFTRLQHSMTAVAVSAQSHWLGQNGAMGPLQLQRGSSRSRLTLLWCLVDATPICTRRTGTCLSSLSL